MQLSRITRTSLYKMHIGFTVGWVKFSFTITMSIPLPSDSLFTRGSSFQQSVPQYRHDLWHTFFCKFPANKLKSYHKTRFQLSLISVSTMSYLMHLAMSISSINIYFHGLMSEWSHDVSSYLYFPSLTIICFEWSERVILMKVNSDNHIGWTTFINVLLSFWCPYCYVYQYTIDNTRGLNKPEIECLCVYIYSNMKTTI